MRETVSRTAHAKLHQLIGCAMENGSMEAADDQRAYAAPKVTVAVRVKPAATAFSSLKTQKRQQLAQLAISHPRGGDPKSFAFDHVWDTEQSAELFEAVGRQVIDHASNGYNSSVFAYGQTGSGKTHTMYGTPEQPGLIPRICSGLFANEALRGWSVEVSRFEIYNEAVLDLLNPQTALDADARAAAARDGLQPPSPSQRGAPPKQEWTGIKDARPPPLKGLQVREHAKLGVYVDGLVKNSVSSLDEIGALLRQAWHSITQH
jgi:hypothetical protein